MACKTGSELCREDLLKETSCCSGLDSDSDGLLENLVLDEDQDMGIVGVATDAVLLEHVRLATGSSSLISTNLNGCCKAAGGCS